MNLPSIRKEHKKFNLSGSSGGADGCASSGSGSRPNSSSLGWTKPKDASGDSQAADVVDQNVATKFNSKYFHAITKIVSNSKNLGIEQFKFELTINFKS